MHPESLIDLKLPASFDVAAQKVSQAADAWKSLAAKSQDALDKLQSDALAASWAQGAITGALIASVVIILLLAFFRRHA